MARKTWGRSIWSYWSTIFRDEDDAPEDIVVEEKFTLGEAPTAGGAGTSGGGSAKRDPKLSIVKKIGLALSDGGSGSTDFVEPEYNFQEITDAYNAEGYIRQAIDKYIEMMFKADWDFVGRNPNAVDYVKMRFKLMAEATQIPTSQLFIEMAEDIVKYSNTVVAKARAKDALPFQGLNVMGVGDSMPVAGYFPINLSTLTIKRDTFGIVKGWQQKTEGSDKTVKFKPEDIVHIYYKREKGRAFGTPFLLPALDDLRALRQIEENVLRLVYRNLHPLWHIKVGLEGEGLGAEEDEVELVRTEVENMDVEGGMVTTERVNINSIASNQIIDAKEYLAYFEKRAFTVLGVSELMMGRGNSANRSTGDNISGEFTDRVKAMQKVMATFVNEFMIKEILMEGGFDPVLNPDDEVKFTFNEIDMDSKIKAENQAVFLYEHNSITEDEMRELIGRDIIEDGDARSKMHLQMVTIAQLEASSALAPAAADSGANPNDKKKETDNKTKPANQSGVKSSPKKTTNSNETRYMKEMFNEYNHLREATRTLLYDYYEADKVDEKKLIGAFTYTRESLLEITSNYLGEDIAKGQHLAITRMLESMVNDVIESEHMFSGSFAAIEAVQTTESVFDVYTDRLGTIGSKAVEAYQQKEV